MKLGELEIEMQRSGLQICHILDGGELWSCLITHMLPLKTRSGDVVALFIERSDGKE